MGWQATWAQWHGRAGTMTYNAVVMPTLGFRLVALLILPLTVGFISCGEEETDYVPMEEGCWDTDGSDPECNAYYAGYEQGYREGYDDPLGGYDDGYNMAYEVSYTGIGRIQYESRHCPRDPFDPANDRVDYPLDHEDGYLIGKYEGCEDGYLAGGLDGVRDGTRDCEALGEYCP